MWSRARLRFLATTVMIVVARALDAWTTWVATPDLELEANPLERLLHLGWWGMLLMNAIVVSLVAYAAWRAAFRPPALPSEVGLDLEAFIGGPGAGLVIVGSIVAAGWNLLVARGVVVAPAAGLVGIAVFWGAVLAGLGLAVHVFLRRAYVRYARSDAGQPST